jgi:hypothetical protein
MALEHSIHPIFSQQSDIMRDIPMIHQMAHSALGAVCRSAEEFPLISGLLQNISKSAPSDNSDGLDNFSCCFRRGRGGDQNIDGAVRYYRRAALPSNADGMCNFWRCLEYGKGLNRIILERRNIIICHQRSEKGNAVAQNGFRIYLESRIGVRKNV